MTSAASAATSGESILRGRGTSTRELVDDPAGPAGQQHDPVGEAGGLPDVVGDEQDGQLALGPDPLQLVVEHVAGHRVERAERLVHQQDRCVQCERAGQGDPLPHAAGQLVRALVGEVAQVDGRSSSRARSRRCRRATPRSFSGNSTFAATVSQGNSAELLEHQRPGGRHPTSMAPALMVEPGDRG